VLIPDNLKPVDGVEALADVRGPVERRDGGLLSLDGGVQLVLDVLPVLHGARLRDFPIPHANVWGMFYREKHYIISEDSGSQIFRKLKTNFLCKVRT